MSFGLIARCDGGGLATMTQEIHRHLRPERTLLLDLGARGRGDCTDADYQHGDVYRTEWQGGLSDRAIEWLTAPGIDLLFSAETLYDDRVLVRARQHGIRVVVCAMPELAPWSNVAPEAGRWLPSTPRPELLLPTDWRHETLPGAAVVYFPVARDRLPYTQRTGCSHLYHVTGTAMRDRNGTDTLLAALPFITQPCKLTIRTERLIRLLPNVDIDVEIVTARTDGYWQCVPDDADLLVLPRRYGGLCLPVQECASLGLPALMLSTDPYAHLPFVHALSPTKSEPVRMKGGTVDVWGADPRALAAAIDRLVSAPPAMHAEASEAAHDWAERHAWHGPQGRAWGATLRATGAKFTMRDHA